ncbi:MAG: fumarylacetoacetate hydrolase family protein, partial [Acidimicrobiales bacterium]
MRFLRVGDPGRESAVVQTDDGRCFDLAPILRGGDLDGRFFERDGLADAKRALEWGDLAPRVVDGLRSAPPISRPGAVVGIGHNYAAHAAESGSPVPTVPIIFFKHPNTVIGPYDDVVIPPGSTKTDWEVELAVVIGRRCRYLRSHDEAAACIAGYAVSNDVSERDYQLEHSGGQWSKGKCCETFNPLGPWLVPATDIPDPQQLHLRSWVNGELRQDSTTADMVFPVFELVRHLSQYLVLEPGDVINTGTPQGVALSGAFPYLRVGDRVTLEVEHLGRQ